jgi:hypothetical protein
VIGAARQASEVGKVIAELPKHGVRPVDVSVLAKPETLDQTAAAQRGRGPLAAIGKAADWLVVSQTIERPEFGKLVGAGPLVDVLATSPSTSPVGALVMQGIPQHDARTYADLLGAGQILLLVGVADRTQGERVRGLFDRNGVQAIAYYAGRPYGTAYHGTGPGLR